MYVFILQKLKQRLGYYPQAIVPDIRPFLKATGHFVFLNYALLASVERLCMAAIS